MVIAILVFASSFESLRVSFGSIFGSGSGGTAGSTGLGSSEHLRLIAKGWNFEKYIGNPDNTQVVRIYLGPKYFYWDGEWRSLEWEENENSFTVLVPYSKDGTPARYVIEKSSGTLRGERPVLRVESTRGENCRLVSHMDWIPIFSETWKFWADNQELQLQGVRWGEPQENEEGVKFGFEADLVLEGRNFGVLKLDYWINGRMKYDVELRSAVQATYTFELCTEVMDGAFLSSKYLGRIGNLQLGPENLVPQITILDESLNPLFCLSFYDLAPWDKNTRKFDMSKVKGLEIQSGDSVFLSCTFGDFKLLAGDFARLDPSVRLTSSADAYVDEYDPTSNHGAYELLLVASPPPGGNYRDRSFLRFDLSALPGEASIVSAELYLFALYADYIGYVPPENILVEVCKVENDTWDESTITWQNQPAMGSVIATLPWAKGWVENDITDWVRANLSDKLVSIGLRMKPEFNEHAPYVDYYSKECPGYEYHPCLEIEYTTPVTQPSDTTPPVSSVNAIENYWQIEAPITITATASDDSSGVAFVELWYRYSLDNKAWQDWEDFGGGEKVGDSKWSWSFTAPEGYGYYEFCSIATDRAGNAEQKPKQAETRCVILLSNLPTPAQRTSWLNWFKSWLENYLRPTPEKVVMELMKAILRAILHACLVRQYIDAYLALESLSEIPLPQLPIASPPTVSAEARPVTITPLPPSEVPQPTPFPPKPPPAPPPGPTITGSITTAINIASTMGATILTFAVVKLWWGCEVEITACDPTGFKYLLERIPGTDTWILPPQHVKLGTWILEIRATNVPSNVVFWVYTVGAGVDFLPPTSCVNPIKPYWQCSVPFAVTAYATDNLSGITSTELWYRHSLDNRNWKNWVMFGVDNDESDGWSWSFSTPEGDGYYEFYTIAVDRAGNTESPPEEADARCGVDTLPPVSSVNPIRPYWRNDPPIRVSAEASDPTPPNGAIPSGLKQASLWYRFSEDNISWTEWKEYKEDDQLPWEWSFSGPDAYYQFYSIASDVAGNVEEPPSVFDSEVCIDTTPPEICIFPARPNPFSPDGDGVAGNTSISYSLMDRLSPLCLVDIEILDMENHTVRHLFKGYEASGPRIWENHLHVWDGKADNGELCPDGPYHYRVKVSDLATNENHSIGEVVLNARLFHLRDASFNPGKFNPEKEKTILSYWLSEPAKALSIAIYDSVGNLIRHLVIREPRPAGLNAEVWDGRSDAGELVGAGLYEARIWAVSYAGEGAETVAKVLVIRLALPGLKVPFVPFRIRKAFFYPLCFNPELGENTELRYELPERALVGAIIYRITSSVLENFYVLEGEHEERVDGCYLYVKYWAGFYYKEVRLDVHPIRHLVFNETRDVGSHVEVWDGLDDDGNLVSSGWYFCRLVALSEGGEGDIVTKVVKVDRKMPVIANVSDSPDPFSPNGDGVDDMTKISYELRLPKDAPTDWLDVAIVIYRKRLEFELLGQEVRVPLKYIVRIAKLKQKAGSNFWVWDGRDFLGRVVPNGTYGYLIFAAEELDVRSQSGFSCIGGSLLANPKGEEVRVEGVQSGLI